MKKGLPVSSTRRRWLATGVVSAGTASLLMPTRWSKPVVDSLLMPAHAQLSPGSGGGGGSSSSSGSTTPRLSDPCIVSLVSGDTTTATVGIRVTGSVIPATAGETITVRATATPTGSTAGPIDVVTATDGTYDSGVLNLAGPGITLVDVTATLGSSTTRCQLDVVASSGGSGSGGVV